GPGRAAGGATSDGPALGFSGVLGNESAGAAGRAGLGRGPAGLAARGLGGLRPRPAGAGGAAARDEPAGGRGRRAISGAGFGLTYLFPSLPYSWGEGGDGGGPVEKEAQRPAALMVEEGKTGR